MKDMTPEQLQDAYKDVKTFCECLLAELPSMSNNEAMAVMQNWLLPREIKPFVTKLPKKSIGKLKV